MTNAGFQFSPGVFTVKDADPEETLERFEQYVKAMQMAFGLNRRVDPTTGARVEFDDTDKKYQPSGAGGTLSPPATPHRL